jgi:RimJ/RimL family protein N-acetyltransferase
MADVFKAVPDVVKSAASRSGSLLSSTVHAVESHLPVTVPGQKMPQLSGPGILVAGVFYPVRTLNADDTDALQQFLQEGLSEESRRLRFMSPMPTVPASAAAWLANRDGFDRVALAAMDPVDPTVVVGVVEYATYREGPPEVAVAVADAFQGRGVGSNLLRMLATMSLAAGQPVWRCDVLADNDGPLRLLATVGTVELGSVSGGVRSVEVKLDPHRLLGTTVAI